MIKEVSTKWPIQKKDWEESNIRNIENLLIENYNKMGFGLLPKENKEEIVSMEAWRRQILEDREAYSRLKRRSLWLQKWR